jgi:hypothetical protein
LATTREAIKRPILLSARLAVKAKNVRPFRLGPVTVRVLLGHKEALIRAENHSTRRESAKTEIGYLTILDEISHSAQNPFDGSMSVMAIFRQLTGVMNESGPSARKEAGPRS